MVAVVASATPAQVQFADLPRGGLATGYHAAHGLAVGDVDGDGDLDLVFGSFAHQNRLYFNDGYGRFTDVTAARMPADTDDTTSLALGDVDGDGDLDLVVGNYNQQSRLYTNDGSGTFTDETATWMPSGIHATVAVALGDVDGDGDPDLVVAGFYRQNLLYRNNGGGVAGAFVDVTAAAMPADVDPSRGLALGDVDGDGDLDLVFGNTDSGNNQGQQNRLYRNDGTGTFTDATAAQLPVDLDPTEAVVLGDVDGDGDLDMVTGNFGVWVPVPKYPDYFAPAENRLLLNDGTGTFTVATAAQMPVLLENTTALALGDVDGDGDLDLFVGNSPAPSGWSYAGGSNQLLLNDGAGTFTDASARLEPDEDFARAASFGDLDGDGDLDLVVGSSFVWSRSHRYVNVQNQLAAPRPFRSGQTYELDAHLLPGPGSTAGFAFPFMSLGTASIPLPPFGTIGIDIGNMVPLPMIAIAQPAGVGTVALAVPSVPHLLGLEVYMQALLLPGAGQPRLSNVVHEELVVDRVNLVVNGGFEQPGGSPNPRPSIPGWTTASGCGIEIWQAQGYALQGQFAELDSPCPTAIYQDVPTTAGRSYVLSVAHAAMPGNADNAIQVQWNAATVLALQRSGAGLWVTPWTMHRAVVTATASTARIEIADTSAPDSFGAWIDEVALVELDFLEGRRVVGEVVRGVQDVQILRGHLQRAEAAQNNNDPVGKAAALQAFVAHVQALPAIAVDPIDAAVLVAIAGAL